MILLANSEAWPGFSKSIDLLQAGRHGLDAMVAGIGEVEREVKVRSVGFGGWPNMLGRMEFDAGVMDGTTREVGAVGAVPDTLPVSALAHEVMKRLPHVMFEIRQDEIASPAGAEAYGRALAEAVTAVLPQGRALDLWAGPLTQGQPWRRPRGLMRPR